MKTFIYELGVIDKTGRTHPVRFKEGLNVVTGKSSTGKSALIEIFDYCFASSEYTVPQGVITDTVDLYYVYLNVNGQAIVLARFPDGHETAFFRREDGYHAEKINRNYFVPTHFRPISVYKKIVRDLFLDIDDVDESLIAREKRWQQTKAPTPSIRSFASFMLQHQNLVANKHALFYRFDEKEKRDQAIDHTKIFLGLVDQKFFHLSQESERLTAELNRIKRELETNKKFSKQQQEKVEPILNELYDAMGFEEAPILLDEILRHPQDAKVRLDLIVRPEKIEPLSDAVTQRYLMFQRLLATSTSALRKLQRKAESMNKHIKEEERLAANGDNLKQRETINIAKSVCPFCHTEHEQLQQSAERLQVAIQKISSNIQQIKPMRARFESSLVEIKRNIEVVSRRIKSLKSRIDDMDKTEALLKKNKSLYESILLSKTKLNTLLDSLSISIDSEINSRLKTATDELNKVDMQLKKYDFKDVLLTANTAVNTFMKEIGQNFEFEDSYKPINLHFSFETFDLYHLTPKGDKIFLRSMGSGANWLYCHVTLFLALHKYFASLGEQCAIPSILFLDQPTQVYFPSFKFDKSEKFNILELESREQRAEGERQVDDDMDAVENLFSQLSVYCSETKKLYGFAPQIIVTDHADDLRLSDGTKFDTLVNGNRWRSRGFINPVPSLNEK